MDTMVDTERTKTFSATFHWNIGASFINAYKKITWYCLWAVIIISTPWHAWLCVYSMSNEMCSWFCNALFCFSYGIPDSKVHGANMGPIWGQQDPGGPHVAPWTLLSGIVFGPFMWFIYPHFSQLFQKNTIVCIFYWTCSVINTTFQLAC